MNAQPQPGSRLYFLWDYDIGEDEIRHILRHGSSTEKAWIITRILEYAKLG
jgi:hypothetical protein